ncbi:MAG: DNA mismatch repair protein MutS [Negativicutes bacterium]|nr:DNA mismatch repair protein MutS [Negativicutes bacterium]
MAKPRYTPMIEQYLRIKEQYSDCLLFFRLGDFYEMFFSDAQLAARELEITLTGRDGGVGQRIPMCGVPYHAADGYIGKLIGRGYKVAICEQVEDPASAKGIVRREVVRVVTPGTVVDAAMLPAGSANNIVVLSCHSGQWILLSGDVSVGELWWTAVAKDAPPFEVFSLIYHFRPAEILLAGGVELPGEVDGLLRCYLPACMISGGSGIDPSPGKEWRKQNFPWLDDLRLTAAIDCLLAYVSQTLRGNLGHINRLVAYDPAQYLLIDANSRRNLEISVNLRDSGSRDTLFSVVNRTRTAMGSRQLRTWLEFPLSQPTAISQRWQAVGELLAERQIRSAIQAQLTKVYDFARILSRAETGNANARDLVALAGSLSVVPVIKEMLADREAGLLAQIVNDLIPHQQLVAELQEALVDNPPLSIREGQMIRDGYDRTLDEWRSVAQTGQDWLVSYERELRGQYGIKSLKVGYNRVFGYYIEVTNPNLDLVPASFVRRQTLANAERFITPELKDYETRVLGAGQQINIREYNLFMRLVGLVREELSSLQQVARALATIDCLCSLAEVAGEKNYCRPEFNQTGEIRIREGRHPVVESILPAGEFVPNDTLLNHDNSQFMLITGPNMGGKSTYMRQVALIVILAQCGSFVPATSASLTPVDRIFTRVGAGDDLTAGQSTFMSEMSEVASILHNATPRSLIIFDEIGRGTSTYDGMSIARAVVEYVVGRLRSKTMFATHYHELTELAEYLPGVRNCTVAVSETAGRVVFLKRIIDGKADKSYGIHVAELAGLPVWVIRRAEEILQTIERTAGPAADLPALEGQDEPGNRRECGDPITEIAERLAGVDINDLTPLQALLILSELAELAVRGRRS